MKKIFAVNIITTIALIAFNVTTTIVYADSWVSPSPFYIISADENRIFHFNPRNEYESPLTGIYTNSEIPQLIYEIPDLDINDLIWSSNFLFSSNMSYFVYFPTMNQNIAFQLFAYGQLIATYNLKDLVQDMELVRMSESTASWEQWQARIFDAENNTLTVVTVDDLTYTFDMTTGIMLESPTYFVYIPTHDPVIAMEFFAHGEMIKRHYITDLVRDMSKLRDYTTCAGIAPWRSSITRDLPNNHVSVTTVDERTFLFDFTTGQILSSPTPTSDFDTFGMIILIGGIVMIGMVSSLVFLFVKRYEFKSK